MNVTLIDADTGNFVDLALDEFGQLQLSSVTLSGVIVTSNVNATGQLSGQITVAVAGTAVQGPTIAGTNGFYIRALENNISSTYVGNDGANDVSSANGYELAPGESILIRAANLNTVYFDSIQSGDKLCWIKA